MDVDIVEAGNGSVGKAGEGWWMSISILSCRSHPEKMCGEGAKKRIICRKRRSGVTSSM